ncbi:MAG: hypothetical protein LKJ21_01730 [Oscillospiraceae bacterium]|jgi:hypothetical protein|nr:hypothetical protein [Oscillospiraceae bacterium]MCI1990509.1 hypothetical protein [Oscillospiraceae bacterium]MCI2034635.1 hypothetical protein [Oscillospiraceae bacterium]
MEAGLLFFMARRTSACQRVITRAADCFGVEISDVCVCVQANGLNGGIARLLRKRPMIFLVGSSPERRPDCAGPIFKTLRVPLDRQGEPKGILKLRGAGKNGYLIESVNQAIAVLPDDPYEILKMLSPAFERLKRKFGLPGEFPKAEHPDYEKRIAACMGRTENGTDERTEEPV